MFFYAQTASFEKQLRNTVVIFFHLHHCKQSVDENAASDIFPEGRSPAFIFTHPMSSFLLILWSIVLQYLSGHTVGNVSFSLFTQHSLTSHNTHN